MGMKLSLEEIGRLAREVDGAALESADNPFMGGVIRDTPKIFRKLVGASYRISVSSGMLPTLSTNDKDAFPELLGIHERSGFDTIVIRAAEYQFIDQVAFVKDKDGRYGIYGSFCVPYENCGKKCCGMQADLDLCEYRRAFKAVGFRSRDKEEIVEEAAPVPEKG